MTEEQIERIAELVFQKPGYILWYPSLQPLDTEEDIKEICLSPDGCIHRNFAFCEESIPIILSLIENKKIAPPL